MNRSFLAISLLVGLAVSSAQAQPVTEPASRRGSLPPGIKPVKDLEVTIVPIRGAGHRFRGPEAIVPARDFPARCFKR